MILRRDEPYRVLFPIGLLCAAAGVVPWILFAHGVVRTWPGLSHALIMSQGFFVAVAMGFLGTMLPRRTGAEPLSQAGLVALAAGFLACAAALLAGGALFAELGVLASFVGIGVAAWRRRARAAGLPPSFPLLMTGFLLGATGAGMLLASMLGAPEWTEKLGRALAAQGFMLALVLAMAPILVPIVLRGTPAPGSSARWPHVVAAALLVASFAVEQWLSISAGLALRGAIAAVVVLAAGALAPSDRGGAHRAAFRLALLLVPLGLLIAALQPERRLALLHITYAGGFALLILAVSVHVTLFHAGRAALAERWSGRLVVAILCLAGAMALRVSLEGFGNAYLDAMIAAACLWLAAVVSWGALLLPNLNRRSS